MKSMVHKKPAFWLAIIGCVILVAVLFIITGQQPKPTSSRTGEPEVDRDTTDGCVYQLDLTLDPATAKLKGVMDFTYVNEEAIPMDSLLFMIYPNSFERRYYWIFMDANKAKAYPNSFSAGSIAIENITYQGEPIEYDIYGKQNHELWVELPEAIEPGTSADLSITYEVTVPNCYGRFGYGEHTWSLVNCHPILAVYDDDQYYSYAYRPVGDPFYSEVADYRATITVPEDYDIAVAGHINTIETKDAAKRYKIDAPNRRDFGFVASNAFKVKEEQIGETVVRSYYYGDDASGEKALQASVDALDIFTNAYGEYPYRDYNVVQTDFFIGGMEYPGLALIDGSLYSIMDTGILEMVIAHETAHQWWYAQVGNDQIIAPWIDESLTEFSTAFYFEENYKYGTVMAQQYVHDRYTRIEESIPAVAWDQYRIDAPTTEYRNPYLYTLMAYGKGAQFFIALRKELGEEVFFKALQNYLETYRYKVADREDLEVAFEEASGRELTPWFDEHLIVSIGGNE